MATTSPLNFSSATAGDANGDFRSIDNPGRCDSLRATLIAEPDDVGTRAETEILLLAPRDQPLCVLL